MLFRRFAPFLAGLTFAIVGCDSGSDNGDYCRAVYSLDTCGDYCTDLGSDPNNCGTCGNSCNGLFCSAGVCQDSCGEGTTACGTACCGADQVCQSENVCAYSDPSGSGAASGTGGASASGGTTGSGGTAAATGGSTGDGVIIPGVWNAFVPAGAADMLEAEYLKWWQANYHDCGGIGQGNTVSEGIGYGALITVAMGDQTRFDTINSFYHSQNNSPAGLMDWQCEQCGNCSGNAATDGDLDVAMALLIAASRWGGTYQDQAVTLIQKLRSAAITETCQGKTVMKPGDADGWGGCNSDPYYNPSYWSPGYYRVFATVDPDGAATWNALIDESYVGFAAVHAQGHPDNLFPFPDGAKLNNGSWESSKGYAYNGYDAARVPWRLAIDYAWSGDSRAQTILQSLSSQATSGGLGSVQGLNNNKNSAWWGAVALSGTADSQSAADTLFQAWVNNGELDDGPYYQGTLRMLYLLLAAGAFPSTL